MQKFPRCPVSDRPSKTTTIRSWLFHWPVFVISPVHSISFKFAGPKDYNQSNFTKWDVAWFFPWEWKTAEFYSKDIDSAVENTLVSLQGLSFSKILSLILIHVNDEYFAPTRTAVLLRAYYIPAYITADILRKTTQRLSMDLSNEDIFCQGPKCTLFCSYWTFSELKKVVNFLSWFVPNWYKKFRSAYANK